MLFPKRWTLTAAFAGLCVLLLTAVALRWLCGSVASSALTPHMPYPHPLDLPGRPHGQCPDCPTGLLPLGPDLEAGQTARSAPVTKLDLAWEFGSPGLVLELLRGEKQQQKTICLLGPAWVLLALLQGLFLLRAPKKPFA
jgi:hypothetical protein